ncbi:MAG: AMP-binding protein [Actinobacteria bacterium]|nr:AMP-binding protein [Actinomycetota bacterium]
MQVLESSVPAALEAHAAQQPTTTAVTYVDYEADWSGFTESLTWSQLHQRAGTVAHELSLCAAPGDRALILAPQGLDYVVAFLGALRAGLLAVPMWVPQAGGGDVGVTSVLRDTSPSVIFTTSAAAGAVADCLPARHGGPAVIEADMLDPDAPGGAVGGPDRWTGAAYLQYTSGSTRQPAGVVVSHKNLVSNFTHVLNDYFAAFGKSVPRDTTVVSWVPLYHNMGLFLGICAPILSGISTVLTSPVAFLQRPARWMQLLATHSRSFSPAPNFALELARRMTTDDDMAGLDLGGILGIVCGGERIHATTVEAFTDRFARFNLPPSTVLPSYGLAEATVYVATRRPGAAPRIVRFDPDELAAGHARTRTDGAGIASISYGVPRAPLVRIVDPDTAAECAAGTIGEIWVHGDNVTAGYWHHREHAGDTFAAHLEHPSEGTPGEPWLRTGDLGVIVDDELFVMGRIKDLVIVDGRNHYPDDIEATIRVITGGRVAAISVPAQDSEQLVTVVEFQPPDGDEAAATLRAVAREIMAAVAKSHGLHIADLVLVAPFSIPTTASGKIRRSACAEQYRAGGFARLDGDQQS